MRQKREFLNRWFCCCAVVLVLALSVGCSLRSMAVNAVLPTLVNPAVYLSEEDPELVREALPFLLKTIESIIEADPKRQDALRFANMGFVLYGSAFLQEDAAYAEWDDYVLASELKGRAQRMYLRARDYGLRALEVDYPDISDDLRLDPETAITIFESDDVEALYYLGGAWVLGISLGLAQPSLIGDLPSARSLLQRAIELDEDYSHGALHDAFIALEAMDGSYDNAREHFERAVELSEGKRAGPYVSFASHVSVAEENRQEFEDLLAVAIAIDPDDDPANRLLNIIAQRRAQNLLDHVDDLFFEPLNETDTNQENQ